MAHTIRALFTDIGGILLTNGWDRRARARAAETFDLDLDELNERHHLTFDTYEAGKLSLEEYLQRVVFYETRSFTPGDFRRFMRAQSSPFEEMIDFERRLKERHGLRVVAVSNEGRELSEYRARNFGLQDVIDTFVCSGFVHVRKPDADIYEIALDLAQVEREEVVYLDDRRMFVEVARGLGLHGVVHRDVETTRKELSGLGLDLPG
ncbi:MAG TPA: HAD-IA family hydrolase [Trueperaceae bacterium]|nr:HAD-IA family hydrolase [Trueperaceae bacterium]